MRAVSAQTGQEQLFRCSARDMPQGFPGPLAESARSLLAATFWEGHAVSASHTFTTVLPDGTGFVGVTKCLAGEQQWDSSPQPSMC